ncbi:MAG: hypothetical protein RMN25_08150 [Anaerolineae bacterium]|nr:hypothetical protein [Thermoflexales bacterium]MDW8407744.1 hypothetical protein [Anaerolineae bacterium]
MNVWNVIGHEWAVRRLERSIAAGQLAQSHVFAGPDSVGKATLALAFAQAVLAIGARDAARSQALAAQRKHPDLTWIEPADAQSAITVDQARAVMRALTLAPVEGAFRVAVIDQAQRATAEAQNAILKTLEEPNPATIIVLVAPQADALLPTIVSRCQVFTLRPVSERLIEQALVTRGAPAERARLLAHLARGRPGWALRALADERVLAERAQRLADLRALLAANRTQRFAYAESMSKADPSVARLTLEEWLRYWRDVARAAGDSAGGLPPRALFNLDCAESICDLAARITLPQAVRAAQAVVRALNALDQNANARLVFDALFLRWPLVA